MITGGGGLALLGGVVIIGHIVGSFELSEVLASGDLIRAHPWYPAALVLVLLGAFTKSAQFPFHFWLPNAMAAPTPVSAYLHSATMVKAGVYLLAIMLPILGGTSAWQIVLCSFGGITLMIAGLSGLQQSDLKRASFDHAARFFHNLWPGARGFRTSRVGHDAECAELIAAFLNCQESRWPLSFAFLGKKVELGFAWEVRVHDACCFTCSWL